MWHGADPGSIGAQFSPLQEIFSLPQARLECDERIGWPLHVGENSFIPTKNSTGIIAQKTRDQNQVRFINQKNLLDGDIERWFSNRPTLDSKQEAPLSVVFCPKEGDPRFKTIPLSERTFSTLKKAFGMPPIATQIVTSPFSRFFSFQPQLDTRNLEHKGLILNAQTSLFYDFTLVCVYDATRQSTRAICFGLDESEIAEVAIRVLASPHTAHHYMLLPLLLVDLGVTEFEFFSEARRVEVREIRMSLNMETYIAGNEDKALVDPTKIDLARLTAQVTSLSQSVAGLMSRGRAMSRFVENLSLTLESLKPAVSTGLHLEDDVRQSYLLRLRYLEEAVVSGQDQLRTSQGGLHVQAQAIYSLTAQADNIQNLKSAELSRQIAEASLRTAEESKYVSDITRRDAADMRVIATVTLFFLPGTFTATLFSTSFFNFQLSKQQTVTRWIWLYWIVMVGLTLFVMAAWWITSTRSLRQTELGKKNDEETVDAPKLKTS